MRYDQFIPVVRPLDAAFAPINYTRVDQSALSIVANSHGGGLLLGEYMYHRDRS